MISDKSIVLPMWETAPNDKIDLTLKLRRQVFTEKFVLAKAKQIEMREFFIYNLNGCRAFRNKPTKDNNQLVCYVSKSNEIMLIIDETTNHFFIRVPMFLGFLYSSLLRGIFPKRINAKIRNKSCTQNFSP